MHGQRGANAEGILELWPTIFVRRVLRDHAQHDDRLARWVLALERERPNITTDYRTDIFRDIADRDVAWLHDRIHGVVAGYLKWLRLGYPVRGAIQGWPNVNRFGDYHDYHNHPGAYLSGTYYVQVPSPERQDVAGRRADLRPGCVTFYDPRYAANMAAIEGDPYMSGEYTVEPHPGLLMLWPAFVNHFVHPNLAPEPRISVSFNVLIQPGDEQLPPTVGGGDRRDEV